MRKETIKTVPKLWGKEEWLINSDRYCSKLLHINRGARSSYHYHKKKEETFYGLIGDVFLMVEGRNYILNSSARPITIEAGDKHSIQGMTGAVILEVSTQHDDSDTYRLEESKA